MRPDEIVVGGVYRLFRSKYEVVSVGADGWVEAREIVTPHHYTVRIFAENAERIDGGKGK